MHHFFLHFFAINSLPFDIFNIGFENLSILKIAQMISSEIPSDIKIIKKFADVRSYNLDSSKLLKHGFKPKKVTTTKKTTVEKPLGPGGKE